MTQAQDPNDRNYEIDRKLRSLNRRVERLEDTQITSGELDRGFDRVYDEIDHLNHKLDTLQSDFVALQSEFTGFRDEINQKLDTILRHLTGID
jgi:predicted  nucleic acid-binding Zn-ribbon protein